MKERIKELRKTLGITQEEFARKIGIKRNTLANYEIGRNKPIDAVFFSICSEFNVNESWLRDGTGEMFKKDAECSLDLLAKQQALSKKEIMLIQNYIQLDLATRQKIFNLFNF